MIPGTFLSVAPEPNSMMGKPEAATECSCHGALQRRGSTVVLCPVCVQVSLKGALEKRDQAQRQKDATRQECADCFLRQSRSQRLSQLADESERLREKLSMLREECAGLAVKVATRVVENDERRSQHEGPVAPLEQLTRLNHALYDPQSGSMALAMDAATDKVRKLRFQWAGQVFSLFRLDVDKEEKRPTLRHRRARGVGKIAGLPLPHAGPELYGVLPPNELQSALRLVASLTSTVARCLGIVLPHPILLQPYGPRGDITDTVSQQQQEDVQPQVSAKPDLTTSTATLMSIVESATSGFGRTAKKAFARATGQDGLLQESLQTAIPPSMDISAVSQRLHHATSAVIAEDSSATSSRYALSQGSEDGDQFAVGLQLLQNNVVALCIRAGVPVANLWPAEALLLNLHALSRYSREQVGSITPLVL